MKLKRCDVLGGEGTTKQQERRETTHDFLFRVSSRLSFTPL